MAVNVKEIFGPWYQGFALDKHMIRSTFTGHDDQGHATFNNERTEAGEAVYQLKYKLDNRQALRLANAINTHIIPRFKVRPGLIVPMPASKERNFQPVALVADELGKLTGLPVFHNLLLKHKTGVSLKDLGEKQQKLDELKGKMYIGGGITNEGCWNALLVDDLFDSGASMECATHTLKSYGKIDKVLVAAMTWK
ncbi:ComF family protein [Xanthomonas perforans]|uniref:ComF family protein n=1 Tax=Xanthomonas TaxID=338 RepID=UPI001E4A84A9|nr:ComF family protein [Xanthomonas vesicatoria]MCC8628535.1 ComF family protein [Xanthomonas vesicatoria]MDG4483031.1 ComF family protein [Xanthomonas vesicatoria]